MPDEVLLRDVHPAEVLLADGTLITGARAFVTNKRLTVWRQMKNKELRVAFDMALTEVHGETGKTASGRLEVMGLQMSAIVNNGRGCGCASGLKYLTTPAKWSA